MAKKSQITFAKLEDGAWGLRVVGVKVKADDKVTARKRDGSQVKATIDAVIDNRLEKGERVYYCSIRKTEESSTAPPPPSPPVRRTGGFPNRNTARSRARRAGWDGEVGSPSYYDSGLYDEES